MRHSIVHDMIEQSTRRAQKNLILSMASYAAMPSLARGDIASALEVLREYAPQIDSILNQEKLYYAGGSAA